MISRISAAVFGTVLLFSGTSMAQQDQGKIYIGGALGTATFFDQGGLDYDFLGFVAALQGGYRVIPNLRVEAELAYEETEAEVGVFDVDIDVEVFRVAASAYYDLDIVNIGGLLPYVGGGLGFSYLDAGNQLDGDFEPTAHVEGGVTLSVGSNIDVVPAARLELTDDASNIQFRIGARFWIQ